MPTMYAAFANPADAEKAAGALLDHGALPQDVSILANEGLQEILTHDAATAETESSAKSGISTTTAGDAA
jgi:hypothetical protein